MGGDFIMVSARFFYQLVLIALLWLCLMLHWARPSDRPTVHSTPSHLIPSRRQRRREPKPLAGLMTKPHCNACELTSAPQPCAPSVPPLRIVMTRGRHRELTFRTPRMVIHGIS